MKLQVRKNVSMKIYFNFNFKTTKFSIKSYEAGIYVICFSLKLVKLLLAINLIKTFKDI